MPRVDRDIQGIEFRATLFRYTGRAAQAVRRLKYSRSTSLVGWLAEQMADSLSELLIEEDIIVPVPIHWSRRCHRGFNQAELLASAFPAHIVQPRLLKRTRRTKPQVGLSHAQRLSNLSGAFLASPQVAGKRIILIDDVVTTGGTVLECARALRVQGAKEVGVFAFSS